MKTQGPGEDTGGGEDRDDNVGYGMALSKHAAPAAFSVLLPEQFCHFKEN